MNMVYIVVLKSWDKDFIGKIFNTKEKAEQYIKEQQKFFPEDENAWDIECWRVF